MLITKFNRMIRNKVLWGILAFIIVICFVGFFTPGSRSDRQEAMGIAGTFRGEDVPFEELQAAKFQTYLSMCMMLGQPINITPDLDTELTREAWQRLLMGKIAGELGLTAGNAEVLTAIEREPLFAVNGVFSKARYEGFTAGFLAEMRVSARQFEEFIRSQIVLQKLQNLVGTAAWVPPAELEKQMHMYADSFRVEYTMLSTNLLSEVPEPTAEAAQEFFLSHTNLFVVPEQVRVRYVSFPFTNLLSSIEVAPTDLTNYYGDHIQDYSFTDTNNVEQIREIDEVAGEITELLQRERALDQVKREAIEFVDRLVPDRSGRGVPFETAAAEHGYAVATSALFSAWEPLDDIDAGPDFNREAFALSPNPEEYFSEPVVGEGSVYVLALETRVDPRLPDFDEVRGEATRLAHEDARVRAFTDKADATAQSLRAAVAEGTAFTNAAAASGLSVVRTEPFTAFDAPDELDVVEIITAIVASDPGEVAGPVLTDDGTAVIAYVAERQPADAAALDALRPQLSVNLNRQLSRILFQEWQRYLVAQSDLRLLASVEEEDEADNEDEPYPESGEDTGF